jgi:hypothetical protein
MAEVVYLVATILWIAVVLGAAGFAGWFALKLRAKRRRAHRMLALVRLPVALVLATASRRR